MQSEFFAGVVDQRYSAPKNYTERKLNRLKKHFGSKAMVSHEPCLTTVIVEQGGRKREWRLYCRL